MGWKLSILLLCFTISTQAQKTLSLKTSQDKYLLGKHLSILPDSLGKLKLKDVTSATHQNKFVASNSNNPNFGLTQTVYWVKINLKNTENEPVLWFLENGYAITHYIDFYVCNASGKTIFSAKGGTQYPFRERLVDYRKNIFPIKIPAKTTYTYYFRFQSKTSMQILLTAWNPIAFAEKSNNELYFWGGYLGIIISIVLYNLFVAISLRSLSYTFYIIYIACFGIIQLSIEGLAYQYIWPNATWWTNNNIPFLILLSGFASVSFTQGFLVTSESKKWLHKTLNVINYINASFIIILLLPYEISIKISAPMALVTLLVLLITGIVRLREGYRPARFFVIAWFTFIFGVILLILKNFGIIPTNFITNNTAPIGSALEAILLSVALADRLKVLTQERDEATQKTLSIQKQINEKLETKVQERTQEIAEKNAELMMQNEEIATQRDVLEQQKIAIEEQHIHITSSITYAQRIQQAMLPKFETIKQNFVDGFVLFKPRDIVSGDFYWFAKLEIPQEDPKMIFAIIDCTGHGVPGGFMSMVGNELLNEIVYQRKIHHPCLILNEMHEGIRRVLKQGETGNRDGMDMSIVTIEPAQQLLRFSGAKRPLLYIQNNQMTLIKGDKLPVGGELVSLGRSFAEHTISFEHPTVFYMYSDGYQDQFGGESDKKFMSNRLRDLIFSIHQHPMQQQKDILSKAHASWKNQKSQVDDILVTGIKLK
ncbi:MAG TPA: hypothetical protein DCS93_24260 [Microscillaceae bacterium]|nr:hypothetical protein [Microscillaceae bacterium]